MPISDIVADPSLHVREGLDEATVERYAAIFDSLPPVVVFSTPQGYLLASGFHRLEAARRLGRAEVAAVVREGSRAEAEEFAILDNVSHGRPYTRAERRRAVERMLSLHPERSDNWLAQDLGVSDHTVRSVREGLEATAQIARSSRLLGKDGRERPRAVQPAIAREVQSAAAGTQPAGGDGRYAGESGGDAGTQVDSDRDDGGISPPLPGALRQFPEIPPPGSVGLSGVLLAQGNAVRIPLGDESVHCVAFSPPYWAQRRYKGEQVFVWPGVEYAMPGGVVSIPGDAACEHEWAEHVQRPRRGAVGDKSTLGGGQATQVASRLITPGRDNRNGLGASSLGPADRYTENLRDTARGGQPVVSEFCVKCGAWRGALGLEPAVEMYVGHVVMILREVRRVLRRDGSAWLNLGFAYYGGGQGSNGGLPWPPGGGRDGLQRGAPPVYRDKDLVPIPWLVAIAAQYDDWYLRSPVVWSKGNVRPESATDRLTLDYEHVLLLSREHRYYYDAHGVREPLAYPLERGGRTPVGPKALRMNSEQPTTHGVRSPSLHRGSPGGRNRRTTWDVAGEAARLALELCAAGHELEEALRLALGGDDGVGYEHTLLLARESRYYYDADALREPLDGRYAQRRLTPRWQHPKFAGMPVQSRPDYALREEPAPEGHPLGRNKRSTWDPSTDAARLALELHRGGWELVEALRFALGADPGDTVTENDHLWRVNTQPYRGAHYATWPPALVARMVQAGSPPAVCARCGAPYERLTRRSIATYPAADDPTMDTLPVEGVGADYPALRARDYADLSKAALHRQRWNDGYWKKKPKNLVVAEQVEEFGRHNYRDGGQVHDEWKESSVAMLGWRPGCACFDHPFAPPRAAAERYVAHPVCAACGEPHTAPAVVLDVCAGSGTTVQVAGLLGRRCVGLDVSFAYLRDQGLRRVAEPAKVYRRPALPALAWAEPLPGNEVLFADVADVLPRLPRRCAGLVFLDPPFNLGKDYGGPGDRLREAAYWELLRFWLDLAAPLIKKNGSLVLHHVPLWAFRAADYLSRRGMTFRRWVAWQAGPGPMYQANRHGMKPEHYVFLWFSWGTEREVNQVFTPHPRCARCGDYADDWGGKEKHRDPAGGRMGDVWTRLPRLRSAQKARGANELPLEAALRWVLALTDPGDYVLDAFAGSGTVGAACELGGRRWGGVEAVEDNAPAIRLKALTARGAAEVIAPGALAALPAETRMALAKALQYLWGDGRLRRAGDSALLARGREAAQQALALISDTEHV